jgi:hypothetical protein
MVKRALNPPSMLQLVAVTTQRPQKSGDYRDLRAFTAAPSTTPRNRGVAEVFRVIPYPVSPPPT